METIVKLDDKLLNEAKQLSHIHNTEEVIQNALERYVVLLQNHQQLMDMRGTIEFWDNDDTKQTPLT